MPQNPQYTLRDANSNVLGTLYINADGEIALHHAGSNEEMSLGTNGIDISAISASTVDTTSATVSNAPSSNIGVARQAEIDSLDTAKADKDGAGTGTLSNYEELDTEFALHSNTIDSDHTIPAGKGSVIAGELSGTGSVSGDGSLAVIDEGIHNAIKNPVEQTVDAAGNDITNAGTVSSASVDTDVDNSVVNVTPDMSSADINTAITNDLPAEGGIVDFKPGTYTVDVEPIDLSKPFLYFRGRGDVTIGIVDTFQNNIIANTAGQNNEFFGMEHLELVGNRTTDGSNEDTTQSQAAVRAQHTKVVSVEDVRIADTVDGSLNVGGAYTDFLFVRDSRFEYAGHLAHTTTDAHIVCPGETETHIVDCHFDWATDNAIYLNNCVGAHVAGCRFHDVFVNAFDGNMNNVKYVSCDITGAPPRGNATFYFPVGGSHGVVIRDCHWYDLGTMPDSHANAIRALSGLSPSVEDVVVEGCTFELNNEMNAFRWQDRGEGIWFTDNYITNPATTASRCDDSVDLSMTGNTVKCTTNATTTAGNMLMLANVSNTTLANNHVIDERADADSITNAYRVADTANGNAGETIVENNTAAGTSGASHNVDLDYSYLRYNGLAYNAGDPNTTGQWTGNGIEGLMVRDTTNASTYIYNNGSWSEIAAT